MDEWLENTPEHKRDTDGGYFTVGTTSEALCGIGVRGTNIYWHKQKIGYIMETHPEMGVSVIKSVPNIIENPIAVLKSLSRDDSIVMIGDVVTDGGDPVMAALELTPKKTGGLEAEYALITSTYSKGKSGARGIFFSTPRCCTWTERTKKNRYLADVT